MNTRILPMYHVAVDEGPLSWEVQATRRYRNDGATPEVMLADETGLALAWLGAVRETSFAAACQGAVWRG